MKSPLLHKKKALPLKTGVTLVHDITLEKTGLHFIEQLVLILEPGATYHETLANRECCLVVLSGQINCQVGQQHFLQVGTRQSIFEQIPTDSLYIPRQSAFSFQAIESSQIMLCYAPTTATKEITLIKAQDNLIEHRGNYNNQRLVHTILADDSPIADCLLVVEVYTPGGNFSSYPPHKHDQDNLPIESLLEETYYHQVQPKQGFVFQRVYTDDRSLDETMSVESGDIVIVPKGYHPVGVPDGYTSYYLNIMAGPTRKWQFYNDPDHQWLLNR